MICSVNMVALLCDSQIDIATAVCIYLPLPREYVRLDMANESGFLNVIIVDRLFYVHVAY